MKHSCQSIRSSQTLRWMMLWPLLVGLLVTVLTGCGESSELKLEQARIALASNKPERAIGLADAVLADDPDNAEAQLIQARAQIALDRLGPARLTLDRLNKRHPDDLRITLALLDWAHKAMDDALSNTAFAINAEKQNQYEEAYRVATEQLRKLADQSDRQVELAYRQSLLHQNELKHARLMITHTRRMIEEYGSDAAATPDHPDESASSEEVSETYAQQLDRFLQEEADALDRLLAGLESVLKQEPNHAPAAYLFMKTAAEEGQWGRLMEQARRWSEGTDLPVPIAQRVVTYLLAAPDDTMALADRIELGRAVLRATPAEESESEGRLISAARLMLAEGNPDKAVAALAGLMEEGTTSADAYALYAHALYETGDYEKCLETVRQMLPEMEQVSSVQTLLGLTLWRLGEVDEARQALRKACQLDPRNKLAADAFAGLMAQQGLIGASGEDIDAFYELDPDNPRAIQFKLQHAAATGDTQQVVALIDRLESRPELSKADISLLFLANNLLGRYNAAETWARKLVEQEPDQLDHWMRLAATQLRKSDEAALDDTISQVLKRFPDIPGRAYLMGELYLRTQQYERAVASLNLAVEQNPEDIRSHLALARALASMGRFNSALDQVNSVLEKSPDHIDALALGARVANATGQKDLADQFLKRIDPAQVDPNSDPALAALVYVNRGDLDKAIETCTQAIAAGHVSPMLRLVLAGAYQEKGNTELAEENLVALIRHFPNSAEAYAWLGQFYARLGQVDRGLMRLKEVEVYNPTLAIMAQAGLLRSADRHDEALALLDGLLSRLVSQQDPNARAVADAIAQIYRQLGDTQAADAVYERLYAPQAPTGVGLLNELLETWDTDPPARRLAKLDAVAARVEPNDIPAIVEISRRYVMLGRIEQALAIVQRGLSQDDQNQTLLGVKAGVLAMAGRTAEAISTYQQALALAPQDKELRIRYARALAQDGQPEQAEQELMRLIRDDGTSALGARAALIELYLGLGLTERAFSFVNAVLDKLPLGENAELDTLIGTVLIKQGRHLEAQHRLKAVPAESAYFPSALVALSRSLMQSGNPEEAEAVLTLQLSEQAAVQRLLPALLELDPADSVDAALLVAADPYIDSSTLTYDLAQRWFSNRLRLADARQDWDLARDTIERIAELIEDQPALLALRIVAMIQQGQLREATDLLHRSPRLEGSATGSLLAFALGTEPPKAGRIHPMTAVCLSLAKGDPDMVQQALGGYAGIRTVFADDLASVAEGPADERERAALRDLAVATVTLEAGLPGLAESLCRSALQEQPGYLPALALLSAAAIEHGKEIRPILDEVRTHAPTSSLALLLESLELTRQGDHAGAASVLETLATRHPDNGQVAYQLAQALSAAGRTDEAASALRKVAAEPGPFQLAAKNDLAYLLAQKKQNLDEAIRLAREVLRALPDSPAVMDTTGWVEHLRGRNEAALPLLAEAIRQLSDIPEAHYHVGTVYHALGKDRWARYHLQQAATGEDGQPGVEEARRLLEDLSDTGI